MREASMKGSDSLEISGDALVTIEDGAKARVVIRAQKDAAVELRIGRGCHVESFIIQGKDARILQTSRVGEGSILRTAGLWLAGGEGKIHNILEGPRSEAYDLQVFVGRDKHKLHLDSVLRHTGKDTRGDILVKGVVKDGASARLDGMIKIDKGGAGAESFLGEHVMLLDSGAHASANPELEIENNDVSSRHAASVSRIDEEKIFYLMSRGIGRDEARKLIVEGFLDSAIGRIADEKLRELFSKEAMAAL